MRSNREKMIFAVLLLLAAMLARVAVQPVRQTSALSVSWLAQHSAESRTAPLPAGGPWRIAPVEDYGHQMR